MCTGGYGTAYYLSTNAVNSNVTAAWRAHKRGAFFANPCYTQIHPTCIPVSGSHQSKLTLMSESLRNDGRVWVPEEPGRQAVARADSRSRARLLPRAALSELRQPGAARRRVAQRQRRCATRAAASATAAWRSTSISRTPSSASARTSSAAATATSSTCTRRSPTRIPYRVPMRIYPAIHYTMGGLWVDYNLMSTIPGLHVLGEANFSDHGANRLGASALMQGLADGYFVIPYTLAQLPGQHEPAGRHDRSRRVQGSRSAVQGRIDRLLSVKGSQDAATAAPRARRACSGTRSAWRATTPACGAPWSAFPSCARSSGRTSRVPGPAEQHEQEPRVRRPRGRLPRVRRGAHARRAAPHRIMRRPLPRREPDARRRSAARRRQFLLCRGVGVPGRRQAPGAAQGAA